MFKLRCHSCRDAAVILILHPFFGKGSGMHLSLERVYFCLLLCKSCTMNILVLRNGVKGTFELWRETKTLGSNDERVGALSCIFRPLDF